MKRCVKLIGKLCVCGIVAAAPAAQAQDPIEDLRLPVEYYPDGTLKSELLADLAAVQSNGTIAAHGVVFRLFTSNAVESAVIMADDAVLDRERQTVMSEKAVSMRRDGLRIGGVGFDWSGAESILRIHRHARVTFPSEMIKKEGVVNCVL